MRHRVQRSKQESHTAPEAGSVMSCHANTLQPAVDPQWVLQAVQCSILGTLRHLSGLQRTSCQPCMCQAVSAVCILLENMLPYECASSDARSVRHSLRGCPGQSSVASRWSNTSSSSGERASIRFSSVWEGTSAPLLSERLLSSCSRAESANVVRDHASCLREGLPCIALQRVPAITVHKAIEGCAYYQFCPELSSSKRAMRLHTSPGQLHFDFRSSRDTLHSRDLSMSQMQHSRQ